jgi:hypothetical protein
MKTKVAFILLLTIQLCFTWEDGAKEWNSGSSQQSQQQSWQSWNGEKQMHHQQMQHWPHHHQQMQHWPHHMQSHQRWHRPQMEVVRKVSIVRIVRPVRLHHRRLGHHMGHHAPWHHEGQMGHWNGYRMGHHAPWHMGHHAPWHHEEGDLDGHRMGHHTPWHHEASQQWGEKDWESHKTAHWRGQSANKSWNGDSQQNSWEEEGWQKHRD